MPATIFDSNDFLIETATERDLRLSREKLATLNVLQDRHIARRAEILARFQALSDPEEQLKLKNEEASPLEKKIAKANDEIEELEKEIASLMAQQVGNNSLTPLK
jgi:chromosome segregation ATPase